jgi:glucose-1-phosphate cytidylyltransferase
MADDVPVVIFCGGEGTRMREETEFKPKPMVMVGGLPILYHIMKKFAHAGSRTFILCLGYKGEMIRQFFQMSEVLHHEPPVGIADDKVHCKKEGWNVHFVDSGLKAGTGHRLLKARHLLQNHPYFWCTYGDGLTDADLMAEMTFAKRQGTVATVLAVHPRNNRWGVLHPGPDGKVIHFVEKPQIKEYVNGGYLVLTPKGFDYLDEEPSTMFESKPFERLVADGQMSMFAHEGFWFAMDTYKDFLELDQMWTQGQTPWKKW